MRMKYCHIWKHEAKDAERPPRYGFGPCLRCGQDFEDKRATMCCVCWKMRLPKRKEKP